jgi:hypothetical protein
LGRRQKGVPPFAGFDKEGRGEIFKIICLVNYGLLGKLKNVVMSGGMMGTKSTFKNAVALIRFRPDANSLAPAVDLCQGFKASHHIPKSSIKEKVSRGEIPTEATIRSKVFFEGGK